MKEAKQIVDVNIAAVYGRVSSDDQAGNASTRGQITEAEEFCKKKGLDLKFTYFDEAKSGKSVDGRLQLTLMLEDARAGKFKHLVVWKLTRLSRNLQDTLRIITELEGLGIKFHSIAENEYDLSTPMGRMMLNMMATIAEYEREGIVENVRMGMKQRAKEGAWGGGKIIGYRAPDAKTDGEAAAKSGKLIIVPDEAAIVRKIFKLYAEGNGLKSITNKMNKGGYRTKNGNLWGSAQIGAILDNPTFTGTIRFSTHDKHAEKQEEILVENAHEAIIDKTLWDKVQLLRSSKNIWPGRVSERSFPLTGLIRCPQCGAGMIMSRATATRKDGSKRINEYYACSRWVNQGTAACRFNGLPAEEVERVVLRRLKRIVTKPTFLEDIMKRINGIKRDEGRTQAELLASIEKKRVLLKKQRKKYIALFDEDAPDLMLQEDIARVTADLYKLDEEEVALKLTNDENEKPVAVSYYAVRMIMDDFVDHFHQVAADRQRALLRVMLKEITFNKGNWAKSIQLHINDDIGNFIGMSTVPAG
ncbi:MAG: recombinase family protein [bacterium]